MVEKTEVEKAGRLASERELLGRAQRKNNLKMVMLRRARRFLFRSVPSAILWEREASTRLSQTSMVCLDERRVRLLDSLTQMPTRTKVSPRERRR